MKLTCIEKPVTDPSIPTWRIYSLSDLVHFIEKYCEDELTIFRGQREDKELLPRVARVNLYGKYLLDVEQDMIRQFEKEAVTFVQRMPDNDWDLLALAQHHGLPTRLLDWTRNPLSGLWFAIHKPPKNKKKDAVVWVLTADEHEDIVIDANNTSSPFKLKRTNVFIPRHISSRIPAQDGIFTVHNLSEDDRVIPLNEQKEYIPKLKKILVHPNRFPRIRYELDRCGINAATLFPDLDGLSRRIEWRHTFSEDE